MNENELHRKAELLIEILKMSPSQPTLWNELGATFTKLKIFDRAVSSFINALELEPKNPTYHYNLGDAYLGAGNPKAAIEPLQQSVTQDPDFLLAHYDLSLAYFLTQKFAKGADAARKVTETDSEMTTQQLNLGIGATNNLAVCLMNQGKLEAAFVELQNGMKAFDRTFFNTGLILFKMKRFEEAIVYFNRAIEIRPQDSEYLDMLANTYLSLNRLNEAKATLEKAVLADPNYGIAHYDLGVVLAKIGGNQRKSLRSFLTAIEYSKRSSPESIWSYYAIACLYALDNKKILALQFLEKALKSGFSDREHISHDSDFDGLRNEVEFETLIRKYFK